MIKINFNHTDYSEMLQYFADIFRSKIKNNSLHLPADIGEGFMKVIMLPDGLQGVVYDYTLKQDILLSRTKINNDFYTLRFDEVIMPGSISSENVLQLRPKLSSVLPAVFLGSTKFDWMFLSTKGTKVKGANILFSTEWPQQFFEAENVGNLIKKYFSLKKSLFNYEPMDMEYKRMFYKIFHISADLSFDTLIIQNRIMMLLERFFRRIADKMRDMRF